MKQATLAIEMREQSYQSVLSIRTRTDITRLPGLIAESYSRIRQYLNDLDIEPEGPPFVAYYNFDMNDLDVEMGFPVDDVIPGDRDMCPGELERGRMVTCMYEGAYDGLKDVYAKMNVYIEEKGLKAKGISYEFYYNSPADVKRPEELMTRIDLPVY